MENEKQFEMIIPERVVQDLIESKLEKRYNPESLEQIAIVNLKKYEKKLVKKMTKQTLITLLIEHYKWDLIQLQTVIISIKPKQKLLSNQIFQKFEFRSDILAKSWKKWLLFMLDY